LLVLFPIQKLFILDPHLKLKIRTEIANQLKINERTIRTAQENISSVSTMSDVRALHKKAWFKKARTLLSTNTPVTYSKWAWKYRRTGIWGIVLAHIYQINETDPELFNFLPRTIALLEELCELENKLLKRGISWEESYQLINKSSISKIVDKNELSGLENSNVRKHISARLYNTRLRILLHFIATIETELHSNIGLTELFTSENPRNWWLKVVMKNTNTGSKNQLANALSEGNSSGNAYDNARRLVYRWIETKQGTEEISGHNVTFTAPEHNPSDTHLERLSDIAGDNGILIYISYWLSSGMIVIQNFEKCRYFEDLEVTPMSYLHFSDLYKSFQKDLTFPNNVTP